MISIDDFKKVEIKIGTVLTAEKVPDADKLLRLTVDFGLKPSAQNTDGSPDHSPQVNGLGEERDIRQIISGIAEYFPDPAALVGRQSPFVTNLEPRTIRGLESQGMILAIGIPEGVFSLMHPDHEVPPGSGAK